MYWHKHFGKGHLPFVTAYHVTRYLIINLYKLYQVRHGSLEKRKFTLELCLVRVQVPFYPIVTVCLRLRHPTFIFRKGSLYNRHNVWDRARGNCQEMTPTRTIEFTRNSAFGEGNTIRIFFDTRDGTFRRFAYDISNLDMFECRVHPAPMLKRAAEKALKIIYNTVDESADACINASYALTRAIEQVGLNPQVEVIPMLLMPLQLVLLVLI